MARKWQRMLGHDYVMVVREFRGPESHIVFGTQINGASNATLGAGGGVLNTELPDYRYINHSFNSNLAAIPVRHASFMHSLALFALPWYRTYLRLWRKSLSAE
uniref:CN hydrolase domain-containing protein n=1 Tax=Mesocestoides corti TaxID=53468 RepID=A0A5K3FAS8_MESCO